MRLPVRDTTLFFDVAGAKFVPEADELRERPTLILVHGGPGGDHSWFKPVLDSLSFVAQLTYLDLRGHGRSDPGTANDWTLASWADDLAAFCEAASISAPVVMGLSWGVAVVGTYAARHPAQPGKLILVAGVSRRVPALELAAVERVAGSAARALGERFYADPTPANEDAYDDAVMPFRSGMPPDERRAAMARILPCAPGLTEHWYNGEAETYDLRAGLNHVVCPTLILAGERDPVCPPELSAEMAEAIGSPCRLEVLPGGMHTLFWETPQSISMLREFLTE